MKKIMAERRKIITNPRCATSTKNVKPGEKRILGRFFNTLKMPVTAIPVKRIPLIYEEGFNLNLFLSIRK